MNFNRTREYTNTELNNMLDTIKKRKLFYLIFGLAAALILPTLFLALNFEAGYAISVIVALFAFGASLYCANTIDYMTKGKSGMTLYKLLLLFMGGFIGTLIAVYIIDKVSFLGKLALGVNI